MYEEIIKDPEFLKIMNEIEKLHFITLGKWDWEHGIGHVKRVSKYMECILNDLNMDKRTIELGLVAGILHDIGLISGKKEGHAIVGSQFIKEYLKKYDMVQSDIDIIAQAISDHSNGLDVQSVIGASLLLADKIDISKLRVINSTIRDEFNEQIMNIEDVKICLTEKEIIVKYITNGKLDLDIFKSWSKPIVIPLKVAKYFNKECIFMIDDNISNFIL